MRKCHVQGQQWVPTELAREVVVQQANQEAVTNEPLFNRRRLVVTTFNERSKSGEESIACLSQLLHTAVKASGVVELVERVDEVAKECLHYSYKVFVVVFFWRGRCEYHLSL